MPSYGTFENDVPERVIGAKVSNGQIYVMIEWKVRGNGTKPSETTFINEVVKERCPRMLVEFYESRINAR